jgi:hypothetical protein
MKALCCLTILVSFTIPMMAQDKYPTSEEIGTVLVDVENARKLFLEATENLRIPPSSARAEDGSTLDLARATRESIDGARRSANRMAQQIRRLLVSDEIQASELFEIVFAVSEWPRELLTYWDYAPDASVLSKLLEAWNAARDANRKLHLLFLRHLLAQDLELEQCRLKGCHTARSP